MGNVHCKKCGIESSYYNNRETRHSCRVHIFNNDRCNDCNTTINNCTENCAHAWKYYIFK